MSKESPMPSPQPSEAAVEALAERNAIKELWGWWEDTPSREAKEGRQRQRYAQLSDGVKESWRRGAREQLAIVYPALRAQVLEEVREAVDRIVPIIGPLTHPRAAGWPAIEYEHAAALVHAFLATLTTEDSDRG